MIYPISNYILLILVLLLGCTFLIFIFFTNYTRHADTVGVLEPTGGIVKILSPQIGVMKTSNVKDGQFVKKGDVLFIFSAGNTGANGEILSQALDQNLEQQIAGLKNELGATEKLNLARTISLKDSLTALAKEKEILDGEIHIRENLIRSAHNTAQKYGQLLSSGYAPDMLVRQKQDELLAQQANLQNLKKLLSNNDSERVKISLELANVPLQSTLGEAQVRKSIEKAEADLRLQKYRGEWSIIAPCDGIVSSITIEKNQTAYNGHLLATILPAGSSLIAQLYAPSRALGFIKPGQRVVMRVDAYPYQKFGVLKGTVTSIADSPTQPTELFSGNRLQASNLTGEALYTIRVEPDHNFINAYGLHHQLKAGMQLSAQIELDTRIVFEWMLEPLYSMRGN